MLLGLPKSVLMRYCVDSLIWAPSLTWRATMSRRAERRAAARAEARLSGEVEGGRGGGEGEGEGEGGALVPGEEESWPSQ